MKRGITLLLNIVDLQAIPIKNFIQKECLKYSNQNVYIDIDNYNNNK